jgi:hypothetical protein
MPLGPSALIRHHGMRSVTASDTEQFAPAASSCREMMQHHFAGILASSDCLGEKRQ